MRRGGKVLVLLGIVMGVLTAGGTFLVLSTPQPTAQPIATRSVVIAQQNIPNRTEILPAAVGRAEWPEGYVPTGAYDNTSQVTGKLTLQPIYQGQIILPQMIVDKSRTKDQRSNASYLVPDGKVAVAFPNSVLSGVAGAVQAGDYVDILLTLNPGSIQGSSRAGGGTAGTEGQPVSQIMLQDVLILQLGTWSAAGSSNSSNTGSDMMTLVLDRQDALALKSAREQGTMEMVLRPAGDHNIFTTEPVTIQYLNKRFNFNLTPNSK
jgi:pilus assembly protein CpaB